MVAVWSCHWHSFQHVSMEFSSTHAHTQAPDANGSQMQLLFKDRRQWEGRGRALGLVLSPSIRQHINNPAVAWGKVQSETEDGWGRGDGVIRRSARNEDKTKGVGMAWAQVVWGQSQKSSATCWFFSIMLDLPLAHVTLPGLNFSHMCPCDRGKHTTGTFQV